MNSVVMTGRLTKDVELRFIPNSGTAVVRFGIAVNREFKKEGQSEADFFNVVVWGKTAEACGKHLVKGLLVCVKGALRNNNYEDKQGVKHYNNEINADQVEFLEWKKDENKVEKKVDKDEAIDDFQGFQAIDSDLDVPF